MAQAGGTPENRQAQKQRHMDQYIEWLLTPLGERELHTKAEFAESIGVSRQTLYLYDKDPYVQEQFRSRHGELQVKHTTTVLSRLMDIVENAADREATAAARVVLQYFRDSTPTKKEPEHVVISDEEFAEAMRVITLEETSGPN